MIQIGIVLEGVIMSQGLKTSQGLQGMLFILFLFFLKRKSDYQYIA